MSSFRLPKNSSVKSIPTVDDKRLTYELIKHEDGNLGASKEKYVRFSVCNFFTLLLPFFYKKFDTQIFQGVYKIEFQCNSNNSEVEILLNDAPHILKTEIKSNEIWTTSISVEPNETIQVECIIRNHGQNSMKFKFDVFQQYKTIFEREGEIGYKEANNYEMALSAGQFFLVAQMRPPFATNSGNGFLLEYKIPGYSEILKEEIIPNKIFKSEPITIREDIVQHDGGTTKRIIVTQSGTQQESTVIASHSLDDYKNVKICITGTNREKLIGFNVKILQSLGVREFRMHRDRIEQMEIQSFREIMEQAIASKNLEDLKLMLTVVENKGYAELIELGKTKLAKLQKALQMRERVTQLLMTEQYEDTLKEVLEELYTIRDYHTIDDFDNFDAEIFKLEELLKQSKQDKSVLETLNGIMKLNDSKKMEEAKQNIPSSNSLLVQNALRLLDSKLQQVKKMEDTLSVLNTLIEKRDLKPLERRQMDTMLKQLNELPPDLQLKCSKTIKKANKKLTSLEKNSKATKELTRIIVEDGNPKKIVAFVLENKAYLSEEDIKKADTIAAKMERGETQIQLLQEFKEKRELDLLLDKSNYSDDEEEEELVDIKESRISDDLLKQLEYDSEDEISKTVEPEPAATISHKDELKNLLLEEDSEEELEKSRSFKIQKKETSTDSNSTIIRRNRSGTKNSEQVKLIEKKPETEQIIEVIPTVVADYSEYDDDPMIVSMETKPEPIQQETSLDDNLNQSPPVEEAVAKRELIIPHLEEYEEVDTSIVEEAQQNTASDTANTIEDPIEKLSEQQEVSKGITEEEIPVRNEVTVSDSNLQNNNTQESAIGQLQLPSVASETSLDYGSDEEVDKNSLAKKVLDGEKKALFADKPATKSNTINLEDAQQQQEYIQSVESSIQDTSLKKKVRFDLEKIYVIRFDNKAPPRSPSARRPSSLIPNFSSASAEQDKLVKQLKEGDIPLHFQRRNLSSHALTDKLHNCIIKLMQATTDNIVTRETAFVYNVITCLEDILLYRSKKKYVFFKERTVYDIFKGFKVYQIQAAIQYFELHNLAKKESYQSESLVFIQFLCETADLAPFVIHLLKHPEYTNEVYYSDSLIQNTKHHDDLISVLTLLQQLRFEFGYIPIKKSSLLAKQGSRGNEENGNQENAIAPLQTTLHVIRLKQLCKGIVELYMANEKQTDDYFEFKLASIVRTSFCQELLYLLSDNILCKNYAAGPFHFWEIIEYIAKQCQVVEIQDLSQLLESTTQSITMSEIHSNLISTVKQVFKVAKLDISTAPLHNFFKFKLFVCIALNTQQLGNFMELFFYHFGETILQKFYGKESFVVSIENRKRIIGFCKTLCKLPFRLQLDHDEIYQKVNVTL